MAVKRKRHLTRLAVISSTTKKSFIKKNKRKKIMSSFPSNWGQAVEAGATASSSSSSSPVKPKKKTKREQVIPEKYAKGAYQNNALKSRLRKFRERREEQILAKSLESKLNVSNESESKLNASTEDGESSSGNEEFEGEFSDSEIDEDDIDEKDVLKIESSEVKAWLKAKVEDEAARVSEIFKQIDPTVHCLPMTGVNNYSIVSQKVDNSQKTEDGTNKKINTKKEKTPKTVLVNRVEFDTGFNFEKVEGIQVSEKVDASEIKKDHEFVTLMLTAGEKCYLCVGYLFPKNKKNKLTDWIFMNVKGEEVQLHTDFE